MDEAADSVSVLVTRVDTRESVRLSLGRDCPIEQVRTEVLRRGLVPAESLFRLKLSGRRKPVSGVAVCPWLSLAQVLLEDPARTLGESGVKQDASLLLELVSAPSEGAKGPEDPDEEAEFDEGLGVSLPRQAEPTEARDPPRKRPRVEVSEEYRKRRSAPSVVSGSFGDTKGALRIASLVKGFLSPEKVSSEDRLGEMSFSMFTAAARLSAIQNARRDLTIVFVEGDPPTLKVSFRCNRKSYEDVCRFYSEEALVPLIREVYKTTVTRTRRSPDGCKRLFEVKELCSRAPYVLWSVAFSKRIVCSA